MAEAEVETNQADAPSARPPAPGAVPIPGRSTWETETLHARSGLFLVFAFLIPHLLSNASALGGGALYASIAGAIERSPARLLLEVFVFVPLGVHVMTGLRLWRRPVAPEREQRLGGPTLTGLHRASAALLFAFLAVHVWDTRLQRLLFGAEPDALYTILTSKLSSTVAGVPLWALLYVLGTMAGAFHAAHGLFAAKGSALPLASPERNRARFFATGFGVLLFLLGVTTVIGLSTGTRLLPAPKGGYLPCGPSAVPVGTTRGAPSPSG